MRSESGSVLQEMHEAPFWFEAPGSRAELAKPGPALAEPEPAPILLPAPAPAPILTPAPEPAPAPALSCVPGSELERPSPVITLALDARQTARTWSWTEPWSFDVASAPARSTARGGPSMATARPHHALRGLLEALRWRPTLALAVVASAVCVWIAAPRSSSASARQPSVSAYAEHTIPSGYLHEYWRVAAEYGLDWTKLAAVGQIESDHGRSTAPGVRRGTNFAGAAGPAQFLASTWARFGVDADGRGAIDPYDPADAITAMAAYLKASGAPQHWGRALYAYNHSITYVRDVLSLSRRLLGTPIAPPAGR